ncbi:hypothetical protein [Demequina sp.]|uniref:hypothetical protein n=1 Tax=Demequina sp. TaxID=2050685 RepID=UPI003D123B4B
MEGWPHGDHEAGAVARKVTGKRRAVLLGIAVVFAIMTVLQLWSLVAPTPAVDKVAHAAFILFFPLLALVVVLQIKKDSAN